MRKYKISIILLLILNFILLFRVVKTNTPVYSTQNNIKQEVLQVVLSASYAVNGKEIKSIKMNSLLGKEVDLKKKLLGKTTLLFVYSEVSCNSCVDSIMINCNRTVKYLDNEIQVLGIVHSNNLNYVRRFARINNLKFPLFWDNNNEFSKSLNIDLLPAVFLVDEKGKIINSYFIDSNLTTLTKVFFHYLRIMQI